jgi:ABC-type glycerol-3-phosphate transport system permease component
MAAYVLEKLRVPGSSVFFTIIIASLMFVPHVTAIPTFMIVSKLGMVNTYWALIIPKLAIPMNLFLIKQFISQIPDPLLEAARMEGAGEMRNYWSIVMPIAAPAWATLIVLSFTACWNDYFSALIYVQNQALYTLPRALQSIAGGMGNIVRSGAVAAATLFIILPTVLIFVLMQSKVMSTMSYAGIKG